MKLSEAILLGSMNKPQGFGPSSVNPRSKRTCAIGAALDAMGVTCVDMVGNEYVYLYKIWPFTNNEVLSPADYTRNRISKGQYCSVDRLIWTMNDSGMTREAIAEWIKTIEPQQEGGDNIEISSNYLGYAADYSLQYATNGQAVNG